MINEGRFKLKGDGTANYRCFCKHPELIENYDKAIADTTQTWDCHHRLETHNSDGERRSVDLTAAELMALGTYHDRPPEELIFLTHSEHTRLHSAGRKFSEEHKAKMSAAQKGKHHSEESKARMSAAKKGKKLSEEHKAKLLAARKGKHLSEETKAKISTTLKGKKVSEETRAKMSAIRKGKKHGPHSEETKAKISAALKGRPSKRKRMHCKLLILTKES